MCPCCRSVHWFNCVGCSDWHHKWGQKRRPAEDDEKDESDREDDDDDKTGPSVRCTRRSAAKQTVGAVATRKPRAKQTVKASVAATDLTLDSDSERTETDDEYAIGDSDTVDVVSGHKPRGRRLSISPKPQSKPKRKRGRPKGSGKSKAVAKETENIDTDVKVDKNASSELAKFAGNAMEERVNGDKSSKSIDEKPKAHKGKGRRDEAAKQNEPTRTEVVQPSTPVEGVRATRRKRPRPLAETTENHDKETAAESANTQRKATKQKPSEKEKEKENEEEKQTETQEEKENESESGDKIDEEFEQALRERVITLMKRDGLLQKDVAEGSGVCVCESVCVCVLCVFVCVIGCFCRFALACAELRFLFVMQLLLAAWFLFGFAVLARCACERVCVFLSLFLCLLIMWFIHSSILLCRPSDQR